MNALLLFCLRNIIKMSHLRLCNILVNLVEPFKKYFVTSVWALSNSYRIWVVFALVVNILFV